MQSSLGWIDFSSQDRDRVKSVLSLLSDPGMVDELGIGSIRDSFSDALFPGISTIQTRAKYFITIPRIIRDFEQMTESQRRRVGGLTRYLADQEDECARLFAKPFADLPEDQIKGTGIIGISALKLGVVRKPSEIYWGSLRTFELVQTRFSRAEFCRYCDRSTQPLRATLNGSESEKGDDPDALGASSWVRLSGYDPQWRENLSIELTKAEAEFLLHQMNQPTLVNSLLAQLLQKEKLRTLILGDEVTFSDLPVLLKGKIPEGVFGLVQRAGDFWHLIEGAHIRYNCLLQSRFGTPALRDEFEDKWQDWCKTIADFPWERWANHSLWTLAESSGHNVRDYTRAFVEQWSSEVQLGPARPGAVKRLDELVMEQEQRNKKAKARLPQKTMSVRQWIGISELSYRFNQVRRILGDIHRGVNG